MSGEVGEQRTILQEAFRRLGDAPEPVLSTVESNTLAWMQTHHAVRVPSLQLSEWLHTAVQESVDRYLEGVCSACRRAIETLQAVAREMERSDAPAQDEVESLLRDVPRFELATIPGEIDFGHWMLLGEAIVRSRIRSSLQQTVGLALKEELRQYGNALSRWSGEFMNKVEMLLNSYTDAYRVQLQRITESSKDAVDTPQLERDLALLMNWGSTEGSLALQKHG